jgi:hypothetical protein
MEHVNNLKVILRGEDCLIHELHTAVEDFKIKLLMFSKQVQENIFTRFSALRRIYVSSSVLRKSI